MLPTKCYPTPIFLLVNFHKWKVITLLFGSCARYDDSKPGLFWRFPSLVASRNLTRTVIWTDQGSSSMHLIYK